MFTSLKGYRTYIVGVAGLLYAGFGYIQGWLDAAQAMQIVQISIVALGLRAAIK